MMEVAMFLGGDSAVSRTESVGSPSGRARRGQGADAAEHDAATFAAALMSAQMRTEPAPDVLRIDASLERLDPQFRARLERVMERMRDEYGHEVRLVEGFRDGARQDYLYAQGRTRPGPIVTWTRDSAHERGLAADLLVDGRYDNPEGYARLAQVAREEGLRTLGPMDAGHVELADKPTSPQAATAARTATDAATARAALQPMPPPTAQPTGTIARPAAPAEVAAVAPVAVPAAASVARVATVARTAPASFAGLHSNQAQGTRSVAGQGAAVGIPVAPNAAGESVGSAMPGLNDAAERVDVASNADRSGRPGDIPTASLAVEAATVARASAPRRGASDDAADSGTRDAPDALGFDPATSRTADAPAGDVASGPSSTATASGVAQGAASTAAAGAGAIERAEQILELQEAAAAAPRSRVVVRVEDGDGGVGRVRVDLRGASVDAEIAVPDRELAARLDSQMDALDRALRREGLMPEALRAHAAPAAEHGDVARFSAPGAAIAQEATPGAAADAATDRDHRRGHDDPTRDAPRRDGEERRHSPREDRHERGRPW